VGNNPDRAVDQRDVDEGRRQLNYSEWNRRQKEARESAKTVNKGEMPPWFPGKLWMLRLRFLNRAESR
jgi:hypothetical protein